MRAVIAGVSFIVGAAVAAVVTTAVVWNSFRADRVDAQRAAFANGCNRGFMYGHAAREVWAAEAAAIAATVQPGGKIAQRAIEIAQNESVKNMEKFERTMAFTTASVVAASEPAKRMCEGYVPYY